MTNTFTGTYSEQHREINPSNIKYDLLDLQKFISYIQKHNPFILDESNELKNIATGVIADSRVNVDSSVDIGTRIQDKLTGQTLGSVTMKKSEQAVTFAIMRKSVKISGEYLHISSGELYQRLLSISCIRGPVFPETFAYELAPVSAALFHDDGSMRKSVKSQLASYIRQKDPSTLVHELVEPSAVVFDGCGLLHCIPWPKVGTVQNICDSFTSTVSDKSNHSSASLCVVFDSYDTVTTKDPEQKRRRCLQKPCPDIDVSFTTPVPSNKEAFLANKKNKQKLITLLGQHLTQAGVDVRHAGDEGDADVVIVQQALDPLSVNGNNVHAFCEDTDVLVLLLYHTPPSGEIFMRTRQKTISIKATKAVLGRELCMCLPFAHAMSGCDTTSSLYSIGKIKHMKLLESSQQIRKDVLVYWRYISTNRGDM